LRQSAASSHASTSRYGIRNAPSPRRPLTAGQGETLRKLADLQRQRGDGPGARLREARTLLDRALTLAPSHREITAERGRVAERLRAYFPPT
jgi:hypothetical protein